MGAHSGVREKKGAEKDGPPAPCSSTPATEKRACWGPHSPSLVLAQDGQYSGVARGPALRQAKRMWGQEHYFDCGPKGLRVSANQLSNIRLMQVNRHTHSPDSQVDHFHKHREAHGKVDVAFRYMHAESFAD